MRRGPRSGVLSTKPLVASFTVVRCQCYHNPRRSSRGTADNPPLENVASVASSCAVQTQGGDRSHRHRILTAHELETGFTWCARAQRGLRSGPATPHPERAHGHETSPLRGRSSPVRCLDRRPQAQGAPTPTARPRWSGRTARSLWSCDWQVDKIFLVWSNGSADLKFWSNLL